MTIDAQAKNTAQTREAFAALCRQKGWKEPSPACPRQERDAAQHFLALAWNWFQAGNVDNARSSVAIACAIIREGEGWDTRSIAS